VSARLAFLAACAGVLALSAAGVASAEPYLAVQQGYTCINCHVNPTGGGLRNAFGTVFTENVLPANSLPSSLPVWSGAILDRLRIGADLRASDTQIEVPDSPTARTRRIDQIRAYADLALVKDWLDYYVDEGLAPGNARPIEYYGKLTEPNSGIYLKGGQFYLPFGWRLQDNTALVRETTGISMTTPDRGFELGLERPGWSAQLDYTRGAANLQSGHGHELNGQVVWIRNGWRAGAAASRTSSALGDRQVDGLFAGLRTGPVAWLGELDYVRDAGYPEGTRRFLSALGEADWAIRKGHNLKLTAEYLDPDLHFANDQQTRWSLLYEYTPIPFAQLRAGFRRYRGIPQNDVDNRHVLFLELHLFM
jgi:hypothetical protein